MPHKPYDLFLILMRSLHDQPNEQREGSIE